MRVATCTVHVHVYMLAIRGDLPFTRPALHVQCTYIASPAVCATSFHSTHLVWARTWLWRARNETLLSIATRDLAHSLTTCRWRREGEGGGGRREEGGQFVTVSTTSGEREQRLRP